MTNLGEVRRRTLNEDVTSLSCHLTVLSCIGIQSQQHTVSSQ